MSEKTRKELQAQYKEREVTGGVYVIRNLADNRLLVDATTDLQGIKNRFAFSQKTGSCVYLKLQKDWAVSGGGGFALEVLEELNKGETQTQAEFKADIDILRDMWLDKLSGESFY